MFVSEGKVSETHKTCLLWQPSGDATGWDGTAEEWTIDRGHVLQGDSVQLQQQLNLLVASLDFPNKHYPLVI
jgi:hypothetical protein